MFFLLFIYFSQASSINLVKQIAVGQYNSCAILQDGKVKCWGLNNRGQLGLGDTITRGSSTNQMGSTLQEVNLGDNAFAISISIGNPHSCALIEQNGKRKIKCWGGNASGQLGMGDTTDRGSSPNQMGNNLKELDLGINAIPLSISAGYDHTCALIEQNGKRKIKCWGNNSDGQLGTGDASFRGDQANEMGDNLKEIDLGSNAIPLSVTSGGRHGCALIQKNNQTTIKCWGENVTGQLGLEDSNNRGDTANEMGDNLKEVNLGTDYSILSVSAGYEHTCALLKKKDEPKVKCWGRNQHGQLGLGDSSDKGDNANEMGDNLKELKFETNTQPLALSPGGWHNCVLVKQDNKRKVKCFGWNTYGQLGLEDSSDRGISPSETGELIPSIDLGMPILSLFSSASADHSCVITINNLAKCWGLNGDGQLGLEHSNNMGIMQKQMGAYLPFIDLF